MIRIYNSLTNKVEEFVPIKENEVSMYVCGSTVYNEMHIGNSRPVIFFDTVARFFKYMGYKVTFVSNFTDIDDKIINKALSLNISEEEVANRYIQIILDTYKLLNCLTHDKNPRVTETMPKIIEFIERLVENESAYVIDGDVYFDISKAEHYGILSGQTMENLISGSRIEENNKKKNQNDFNLWKKTEIGAKYASPWSMGRPGWHTECVVMIDNIFNGKIDIHGGGLDLKFPHHENEIAQSYCSNRHFIANYWMHNGRIDFDGEKMSKSLGNTIWAKGLVEEIGYLPYRLIIHNVPYRQPLNYKEEVLAQAKGDAEKIKRAYYSLYRKLELDYNDLSYDVVITNTQLLEIKNEFVSAMSNDFNTANALTALIKLIKVVNNIIRQTIQDVLYLKELLKLLDEFLWVLGLEVFASPLTGEEKKLITDWQKARQERDFTEADRLRLEISKRNIEL